MERSFRNKPGSIPFQGVAGPHQPAPIRWQGSGEETMSIKLSRGKLEGLKAVSDKRGVIAAAAMDQRGSLKKSLAKEKGVAELPDSALVEFKELVADVLTQHASAILLDPEYGLPASKRRHGKGLLLAYEKTGYDAATRGRLPDLLDLWSVRREGSGCGLHQDPALLHAS